MTLLIVLVLKAVMKGYKGGASNLFNLIVAFMPLQSIIICFIVSVYSINVDATQTSPLGIAAILTSVVLVYLTMILIRNQQKAFQYKSEYELSQQRLNIQVEHYQKLYNAQREVRSIRHNISNNLLAISGLLSKKMIAEAKERIDGIYNEVKKTADIIDSGLPSVDAVINAKIAKAAESDIRIEHKILIDNDLFVDQFDVAILIANALDNAIEGLLRSEGVERVIKLDLVSMADYISILVENQSTGLIYDDFRSSKAEKVNHGFGIEHMKAIAKKYDGDVNPIYDPETKLFTVDILLKTMEI